MRRTPFVMLTMLVLSATACAGSIDDPRNEGAGTPGTAPDDQAPPAASDWWLSVANTGPRALSVHEIDNTIGDLLGDASRPASRLFPGDPKTFTDNRKTPFDNDYTLHKTSATLVEDLEAMAEIVAHRAFIDETSCSRLVQCKPTGPGDKNCLRSFVTRIGRHILRRPLDADEIDGNEGYVTMFQPLAIEADSFCKGAELATRALLMEPEFLFRFEAGRPLPNRPGYSRLTSWEMASRLSFLLLGSAPGDSLLDLAAADKLRTSADVKAAAEQLLADKSGQDNIQRFHALWLGYEDLSSGDLGLSMKAETEALLRRVVFERKAPWSDIFTSTQSYVDSALATNYRLPAPAGPGASWVSYPTAGTGAIPLRAGLLSHGSFLGIAGEANETLMTIRRGKAIRERLFGVDLPPKPAISGKDCDTNVASPCKWEQSAPRRTCDKCAGCHSFLDVVGFGLDNFDGLGKPRSSIATKDLTKDPKDPKYGQIVQCPVHGDGIIDGQPFRGPAQLGALLAKSESLGKGLLTHLFRFAMGRHETSEEQPFIDGLASELAQGDQRLQSAILGLVADEWFLYRRD